MPYPTKLTAEQILEAALTLFQTGGDEALSMRLLAERLNVRPSSLYRYYPERGALVAALENHAIRALHAALRGAAADKRPDDAFVAAAHSYLAYARAQPHLYSLLFAPKAPYIAEPGPGKNLWNELLKIVGALTGNPDDTAAAVAFCAFLHGFALLEASGQFGLSGPRGGFERGLAALQLGFTGRRPT